jgi:hypothetical protein
MKMLRGMFVLGGVAATHMAADETHPQMDPGVPHFQTFFAAVSAWLYFFNFLNVWTRYRLHFIPPKDSAVIVATDPSLSMIALEVQIPFVELQFPLYHIRNESASSGL